MRKSTLLLTAAFAMTLAGAASATPPSGVTAVIQARSGFLDTVDMKLKISGDHSEVIHVPDAEDTVVQQIVIAPGGHTGWHSHPGPVVVLVKSGELTLYDGEDPSCTGRPYSAGKAFIDRGQGHVHIARNLSSIQNVELWVTYFDVPVGQAVRLDADDPGNCAP